MLKNGNIYTDMRTHLEALSVGTAAMFIHYATYMYVLCGMHTLHKLDLIGIIYVALTVNKSLNGHNSQAHPPLFKVASKIIATCMYTQKC